MKLGIFKGFFGYFNMQYSKREMQYFATDISCYMATTSQI